MDGLLIVVSGFSGAGKGTIMKRLLSDYDNYALSVSMTTRNPREGEVNGREYFFVTKEEFENTIAKDGLVEYARYCDNYYGTPRSFVEDQLKQGKNVILEIEVQGAMQIKEKYPDALLVYIVPPTIEVLLERLRKRGTESEEVIQRRITQAKTECTFMDKYEYLVINDDLDTAVKQTHEIVNSAVFSVKRRKDFTDKIIEELKQI